MDLEKIFSSYSFKMEWKVELYKELKNKTSDRTANK